MATLTELEVTNLRVCDAEAPLNVDVTPYFSWQYTQAEQLNLQQTAYQIQVQTQSGDIVWDSGVVQSAAQAHVVYNGAPLAAASRYQWRVQGQFGDEASQWSAWQPFATGLSDADWAPAAWLARPLSADDPVDNQWSLFRKVVTVQSASVVTAATCYVSAVHAFELYVNTQLVDRGQNFAYAGEGYYQASDVTDALLTNKHFVLSALTHYDGAGQGRAASQAGLLVKLIINFADGTSQTVVSDDTWTTTQAPFYDAGLRNGEGDSVEAQDGQQAERLAGWQLPNYDDAAWVKPLNLGVHPTLPFTHVKGLLTRQVDLPVQPVATKPLADGSLLVDFGKIMPLRPQVRFAHGQAGQEVTIQAGYRLTDDGHIDTSKLATQGTDMRFLYKEVAGAQTFTAQIHLGARYLEIKGANEALKPDQVSALIHRRAWPTPQASFHSGQQTLDDVFGLMAHSLINGVQETFVDTPTREKGQFLVDAANVSYGTMTLTGERATTAQAIREFVQSQHRYWFNGDEAGRYNAVYPNGDGKRDIPDYTELFPDWVWEYFVQSSDWALLQEVYPSLRATADYILRHVATKAPFTGLVTELSGGHGGGPYLYGIIDWPVQGRFGYDMTTVARTTVNALAVRTLDCVAQAASMLGNTADAALLTKRAEALKAAINGALINEAGRYVDGLTADGKQSAHVSQHANAYAVAFDIAPSDQRKQLVDWLAAQGMKQGPMTVHLLLKALGKAGRTDAIVRLLTNADDWGWVKTLKDGGTFTPEAWALSGDANSESHAWGAQALADIVAYLIGVTPVPGQPGHFVLTLPDAAVLPKLAADLPTDFGVLHVQWQVVDGVRKVSVTLPVNTQAQVQAGKPLKQLNADAAGQYVIGSGTWQFEEGV